MLFALLPTVLAAPCDTPLTEDGLRDIVVRAKAAIEDGDILAHTQATDDLEARVPCLVDQVPRRAWADYLVTAALVKHLQKAPDWHQPLSVALELDPDHPDIPSFLLDDYQPPAPPEGGRTQIPKGVVVMLDGKVVLEALPPLDGLHIVQTVTEGKWKSLFLRDQPVPAGFVALPEPVEPPPRPTGDDAFSWGIGGVSVGYGSWKQRALSERVVDRNAGGLAATVASTGQQALADVQLGVFWRADVVLQVAEGPEPDPKNRMVPFGDVFLGLSVLQPVSIWVGGGITSVRVQELSTSGEAERPVMVPHYLLGASYHTRGDLPLDVSLGGAWGPPLGPSRDLEEATGGWGSHAFFSGGVAPVSLDALNLRIGLSGSWARSSLGDSREVLSERVPLAVANAWRAGLDVGIRWGGR